MIIHYPFNKHGNEKADLLRTKASILPCVVMQDILICNDPVALARWHVAAWLIFF